MDLPPALWVVLLAMSPFAELRGSMPLGLLVYRMDPGQVFLLSLVGNLLPVLPILLLLEPAANFFRRWKFFARVIDAVFARTRRKSDLVDRYGALGLALFVAVPLPITGAWTGSLLAFLLGMPLRKSVPAVFAGVLIAAVAVMGALLGLLGALRL